MGEQWLRTFAHCLYVLLEYFIVRDYLLVGKFVQAHMICMHLIIWLVCETWVIKSSLTCHVCGRVLRGMLVVDVTRWCLLEVMSHLKMLWQGSELFLVHVLIFVVGLCACRQGNYRDSLNRLLLQRFYRCLRFDLLFVISNPLLRGAVRIVRGGTILIVEGGSSHSGLKARLLHPTLWKSVLLILVLFRSEWVARENELNHCLDFALGFLVFNHLMF